MVRADTSAAVLTGVTRVALASTILTETMVRACIGAVTGRAVSTPEANEATACPVETTSVLGAVVRAGPFTAVSTLPAGSTFTGAIDT